MLMLIEKKNTEIPTKKAISANPVSLPYPARIARGTATHGIISFSAV